MKQKILVRGGGDLASGVILRLAHSGFNVLVTELEQPLVVRRTVSFAEAIYSESVLIEDVTGKKINQLDQVTACWDIGSVPVLPDPSASVIEGFKPDVLIDARMLKCEPDTQISWANLVIGLGPGFTAGKHSHGVIETRRGPFLGRVYWEGEAEKDTGEPEAVDGHSYDRVLRAPVKGMFHTTQQIGDLVEEGEVIGDVAGFPVRAPFKGLIRGLIHYGIKVEANTKIGDIDPRCDPKLIRFVSDKALSIGGGVLEAILSKFKSLPI